MKISAVINLITNSPGCFIKFITSNDAGENGAHQSGVYIPKNAASLFFEVLGEKGENKERFIDIRWLDIPEIKISRVIYYGKAKNEYRITRLGRILRKNDLLILTSLSDKSYTGAIVKEQEVQQLLNQLSIDKSDIGKGILFNYKSSQIPIKFETTGNEKLIRAKFKPKARLLLQLGDQLIKNESIALIELVKNSYDADSREVSILMTQMDDLENGVILVKDDGYGMTADTVENVWLEPGSSFKTKKISANEVSPKFKRLPIGEKGIGRFGVHKLGNIIEMTSKALNAKEVFVKINWTEFENFEYLEDVPVVIEERDIPAIFTTGKTGTQIIIRNLRKAWDRGTARDVKRAITALSSPFQTSESFFPSFKISDKPGWFDGLLEWEDVIDYSLYNFKVTIEGSRISKFEYHHTPWETMTKLFPTDVYQNDKIIESLSNLRGKNKNGDDQIIDLGDFGIGQVVFEGYIFDLDTFVMKMGVTDKKGFKAYLKANGGIKVFRDGLRIYDYGEAENDWLGLDYRRFQQPTKAISNNLVLGSVYLSRKHSYDLVEKTNREGFVENAAYIAFKSSILHALDIIETLRYSDKKKLKAIYGPTPKSAPVMSTLGEAKSYVEKNVGSRDIKKQIIQYLSKIESDYKRVSENLLKAAGAGLSMSVVVHEVEKILYEVTKVIKAEKVSERVLNLVVHLSSLIDGYAEIIRRSNKSSENVIEIIDQSLFNVEYRLASHKISVTKAYSNFTGVKIINSAKNLLIGSLMNIIDNSIYWLQQKKINEIEKGQEFQKKLFINLYTNDGKIDLLIADNGTGFLIPTDDMTEPFVTAKSGGIGLGLHIVNEIMLAQKGKLLFPSSSEYEIPIEFHDGATTVLSFKN